MHFSQSLHRSSPISAYFRGLMLGARSFDFSLALSYPPPVQPTNPLYRVPHKADVIRENDDYSYITASN